MSKLIKCKDCGHQVSKSAKACPNCGAKMSKQRTSLFTWFIAIVLGFGILSAIFTDNTTQEASPKKKSIQPSNITKNQSVEKAVVLQNLLNESGKECGNAIKTFMQGHDKEDSVYWNVLCSNGKSYSIQIPADPAANTRILECDVLKAIGIECFKKL